MLAWWIIVGVSGNASILNELHLVQGAAEGQALLTTSGNTPAYYGIPIPGYRETSQGREVYGAILDTTLKRHVLSQSWTYSRFQALFCVYHTQTEGSAKGGGKA